MNQRIKTPLLAFLVVATAVSAGLAWQQYRALKTLRTASSASNDSELQRRLTEAEHRAHNLENELAALKARSDADPTGPGDGDPTSGPPGPPQGGPGRRGGGNAMTALMDNPEFTRLLSEQDKLRLDGRYASLFKDLVKSGTLTPEQLDAFKNLLVEKQNAARDAIMAARANGLTDRSDVRQAAQNAQAEVDKQIQAQLGDAAFNQYKTYEATLPQRTVVDQLSQRLSYTNSPLSDLQTQQLVQILAATTKASNSKVNNAAAHAAGNNRPGNGPALATASSTITQDAITQAQGVLSTAQLKALQDLQNQQAIQQQLMKMYQAQHKGANTPAAPSTPKK